MPPELPPARIPDPDPSAQAWKNIACILSTHEGKLFKVALTQCMLHQIPDAAGDVFHNALLKTHTSLVNGSTRFTTDSALRGLIAMNITFTCLDFVEKEARSSRKSVFAASVFAENAALPQRRAADRLTVEELLDKLPFHMRQVIVSHWKLDAETGYRTLTRQEYTYLREAIHKLIILGGKLPKKTLS